MSIADLIPPEYLWCRDMKHSWDPDSLVSREHFNRRVERWEIWRSFRCLFCGGHKTQKLTKAYQLLGTSYEYAPNYTIDGGPGYRLTAEDRAQIRALSTAIRGGVEKPSTEDRAEARKTTPRKKP
jgi:hypothetical protein